MRDHLLNIALHMRNFYTATGPISDEARVATMRNIISRVPVGAKLVLLLDHDRLRLADGSVRSDPPTHHYNRLMEDLAAEYPFVGIASFSDVIQTDEQIQVGGNHYDRSVYRGIAERLVEAVKYCRCVSLHLSRSHRTVTSRTQALTSRSLP